MSRRAAVVLALCASVFALAGAAAVRAEPAPGTGTLVVETTPAGAVVKVNGVRQGLAPLRLERVPAGQVRVRADLEGHRAAERVETIGAGTTTTVALVLERRSVLGTLTVTSVPEGAAWSLDGVFSGTTPETQDVASGNRTVTVWLEGYEEWSEGVDVAAGKTTEVTAQLRVKGAPAPPPSTTNVPAAVPPANPAASGAPDSPAGGAQADKAPEPGATWREPTTGMEFVWVPAGEFTMGNNKAGLFGDGDSDEKPEHRVRLDGFWMGKAEVTQGQWKTVTGSNPSKFASCGDACPVEQVSWEDAQQYLRKLSSQSGKAFRLPTEAEWEYAAGGGKGRMTWAGTSTESELVRYAWYSKNAGGKTHPACEKLVNPHGLCDMSGNVWEWCQDTFSQDSYRRSAADNPKGHQGSSSERVLRGGSWKHPADEARTVNRAHDSRGSRRAEIGLRLVFSEAP